MNDLNLQNPEFLKRINDVFYGNDGLVVNFTMSGKYINFVEQLQSPNKPLDEYQQWFMRVGGQEINTIEEFDSVRNQQKKIVPKF